MNARREEDVQPGLPRWVELPLALLGLVVTLPLLVCAALFVRFSSPGPVFFRQHRLGKGGKTFVFTKLRTMRVGDESVQVTRKGDPRITGVGRWLRALKLDELPELWQVVCGEMSLVGPRPEVPKYADPGDPLWETVLKVRPGLTDPVTLRLRNEEALLATVKNPESFYREVLQPLKLQGYVEYLARRSWKTDVTVLWETLLAVMAPKKVPPPTLGDLRQAPATLFRLERWPRRSRPEGGVL